MDVKDNENQIPWKIRTLIDKVVNQDISHIILLDTFKQFIKEDILNQIDIRSLVNDITQVFSNSPLEIVAPISLPKKNSRNINFINYTWF